MKCFRCGESEHVQEYGLRVLVTEIGRVRHDQRVIPLCGECSFHVAQAVTTSIHAKPHRVMAPWGANSEILDSKLDGVPQVEIDTSKADDYGNVRILVTRGPGDEGFFILVPNLYGQWSIQTGEAYGLNLVVHGCHEGGLHGHLGTERNPLPESRKWREYREKATEVDHA